MKYDLINIQDEYLAIIGDNYTNFEFPYLVAEKLTDGRYIVFQVDNPNDWDSKVQYRILGYLPLNGKDELKGINRLPNPEFNRIPTHFNVKGTLPNFNDPDSYLLKGEYIYE